MKQQKQLGVSLLVFVAIGSMIGSGIFNAPKDLISVANPMGTMLTWVAGGAGALMLALVFVYLSAQKPELKSGIYSYAKEGFGDYMGFNSAWGYWSLGWLGNISYFALFFKTLNDLLGDKALSPQISFLIGSSVLWLFFFILKAGVREGAILNFVVTITKLLPIILIIVLGISLVRGDIFHVQEWKFHLASNGSQTTPLLQTKNAMAIVLWCFVGVEAASVLSGRAKNQRAVRHATLISVVVVLLVYMSVTFIAMASIPAKELAASNTPLALVLSKTSIGAVGALVVQTGIMISVMGASISWIILSVETLYAAANDGVMPRFLAKTNSRNVPVNALLLTQIFTQFFLFSILSPSLNDTYLAAITIGTTMALIPYLLASFYAIKLSFNDKNGNPVYRIIALLGSAYSLYVIYAVGLKYLYLSLLFYALGVFVFLKGRHEQKIKPGRAEWSLMIALLLAAVVVAFFVLSGRIDI